MAYKGRPDPPHEQLTLNLCGGWTADLDLSLERLRTEVSTTHAVARSAG